MSIEKQFDKLFKDVHIYLEKGLVLRSIYTSKKHRGKIRHYTKTFLNDLWLLKSFIKKYPIIKKSFEYSLESEKTSEKAYKIYSRIIAKPPKDIPHSELHIFKILWQGVNSSKQLDNLTKDAHNIIVLEQALVAMCTAYEIIIKETIQWTLNNFPEFSKRYIGSLSFPVKELGKYKFEPLKNAGSIFLWREGKDFKIFDNGKKSYKEILKFDLFKNKRRENKLWKVLQTRHCIIHNAGKPDIKWKKKTKNAKFKKDAKILISYTNMLHTEFHEFYYRFYKHIFKRKPKIVSM